MLWVAPLKVRYYYFNIVLVNLKMLKILFDDPSMINSDVKAILTALFSIGKNPLVNRESTIIAEKDEEFL